MGVYKKTEEVYNDFPVYQMLGSKNVIFVDKEGDWSINSQLSTFGFIFNFKSNPPPPVPPVSGWLYWDGSGILSDNYLSVIALGNKFQ